eukprot:26954-Hanusia_phi.AAC.1
MELRVLSLGVPDPSRPGPSRRHRDGAAAGRGAGPDGPASAVSRRSRTYYSSPIVPFLYLFEGP